MIIAISGTYYIIKQVVNLFNINNMSKTVLIIILIAIVIIVLGYITWQNSGNSQLPVNNDLGYPASPSDSASTSSQGADNSQTPASDNSLNNVISSSMIQDMKVEVLKEGTGTAAKNGDTVSVNYLGTFTDGTKFDSSYDRNKPFSFSLGAGQVIKGWDLGVAGMKVGEKRRLTIPSDLAYGPNGQGSIPPNATLVFEVELLGINQ